MTAKLIYGGYITVHALLIHDETPQPLKEAGGTLGEITKYSFVGPVKGGNRTSGRDLEQNCESSSS